MIPIKKNNSRFLIRNSVGQIIQGQHINHPTFHSPGVNIDGRQTPDTRCMCCGWGGEQTEETGKMFITVKIDDGYIGVHF